MIATARAEQGRAVPRGDDMLAVDGALTFDTVPDLLNQSAPWIDKAGGAITIDLKEASRADSAGLALLVEWLRLARNRGRECRLINVPEQVRSLIRVNGLSQTLGVNNNSD